MARLSNSGSDAVVNALTAISPYVAGFTADPTTSGASNEVAGGSYARQAITWTTASGGTGASNSNAITMPIPASTTMSHVGYFSAVSAGTYRVGAALAGSVSSGASPANVTFAIGSLTAGGS